MLMAKSDQRPPTGMASCDQEACDRPERGTDANGKDVANARWNDAHSLECSGKRAVGEGDASRIVRAGENQSKIDVN